MIMTNGFISRFHTKVESLFWMCQQVNKKTRFIMYVVMSLYLNNISSRLVSGHTFEALMVINKKKPIKKSYFQYFYFKVVQVDPF